MSCRHQSVTPVIARAAHHQDMAAGGVGFHQGAGHREPREFHQLIHREAYTSDEICLEMNTKVFSLKPYVFYYYYYVFFFFLTFPI